MKYIYGVLLLVLVGIPSCKLDKKTIEENNAILEELDRPLKIEMGDGVVCYRFGKERREVKLVDGLTVVQTLPAGISCVREGN